MTDNILTVVMILTIFLLLPVAILWIKDILMRPSQKKMEEYSRRFVHRLNNPDLAAIEACFNHPLPPTLVDLYRNSDERNRSDFEVSYPEDTPPDGKKWYIAYYHPADKESLNDIWLGGKSYYAFANDGLGNDYIVEPRQDDPQVKFHDHETGEITNVCPSLSEFMSLSRREIEE